MDDDSSRPPDLSLEHWCQAMCTGDLGLEVETPRRPTMTLRQLLDGCEMVENDSDEGAP